MKLRPRRAVVVGVVFSCVTWMFAMSATGEGASRIDEYFGQPDGLITNEWAYRHQSDSRAHESSRWMVTSGSLFARSGNGYSGVPDTNSPDALSSNGTNSAVFRMVSKISTFENCDITVQFTPISWGKSGANHDWSGFHVFLRYKSETNLFVGSVMREDGTITIKKKTTGGPSNGGTYKTLVEGKVSPLSLIHISEPTRPY